MQKNTQTIELYPHPAAQIALTDVAVMVWLDAVGCVPSDGPSCQGQPVTCHSPEPDLCQSHQVLGLDPVLQLCSSHARQRPATSNTYSTYRVLYWPMPAAATAG